MSNYYEKYIKEYQKTPKGKFIRQKANAVRRGINWELSFEDWWKIWEDSGKWEERGKGSNNYVMSRKMDSGGYSVGNVEIISCRKNSSDSYKNNLSFYKNKYIEKAHRKAKPIEDVTNHWPLNWVTEDSKKVNPFLKYCSIPPENMKIQVTD